MEIIQLDSRVSWAVAIACGFLNALVLIPTKVSGLFFVEILDRYQVSRNLAGYPAFVTTLMRCSGGPFAGYFGERFGINQVMILESLLAAVGISACFFAEDIAALTVCLGLIHGTGLIFINTFLPKIVTIHFRKHLTLAFGITQAGACLGSFFSPPLLLWIFQSYGTSGGFLIVGAIVLNGLPIVLLLNILSPNRLYNKAGDSMKSKKRPEKHLEMGVTTTVTSLEGGDTNITNNVGDQKERDVKTREEDRDSDSQIRNSPKNKAAIVSAQDKHTYHHIEVISDRAENTPLNPLNEILLCNSSMKETVSETGKYRMEFAFAERGMISEMMPNIIHEKEITVATDENINEMQYDSKEESIPIRLMTNNYEKNLLHSSQCTHSKTKYKLKAKINNEDLLKYRVGMEEDCCASKDSVCNTPLFTSESNVSAPGYLNPETQQQITRINGEIIPSPSALNAIPLQSNVPSNRENNQKKVLNTDKKFTTGATNAKKSLRIFLDVAFWIIIITQSLHIFVLVIFWTTMIDFSRDKNIERSKEVYLLMTLPTAEIVGSLGLGWITDRKYLTRLNFSIISFVVMGCSCSLMAWAQEFYLVMASIFVFGVISTGLLTVFPIIILEFFDSENQSMGQASKYCLFGPLSFLNGPLIGYFRGTLGSYAWLYHTIGVVSVVCAALSSLIPELTRIRDEKREKRKRNSKFYELSKKNICISLFNTLKSKTAKEKFSNPAPKKYIIKT